MIKHEMWHDTINLSYDTDRYASYNVLQIIETLDNFPFLRKYTTLGQRQVFSSMNRTFLLK